MIRCAALYGGFAYPASAASRLFLSKHVDVQGMEALAEDGRAVTAMAPVPVGSYYEERVATSDNRKTVT
jgi:hypothetical protein